MNSSTDYFDYFEDYRLLGSFVWVASELTQRLVPMLRSHGPEWQCRSLNCFEDYLSVGCASQTYRLGVRAPIT